MRLCIASSLLAILPACDAIAPEECTLVLRYGLLIELEDSITGLPVAVAGQVRAIDGVFRDSIASYIQGNGTVDTVIVNVVPGSSRASLASGRPGTYRVEVERPEYEIWTRSNIEVVKQSPECPAVATTHVLARLRPTQN
jgi:hypothetical protein